MSDHRILLVGGAGYVGSILAAELLERGYAVRIVDRLYFGDEGIRDIRDRIELVVADMRAVAPEALRDVEAVINVGGLSNDPTAEYNPTANYEMNTVAGIKLAQMCVAQGVRRYVYASSCSIYDRGLGNDEQDVVQDEETPVNPHAAYSGSKRAAEKALIEMASDQFCPIVLRKGTVFGFSPRMRYDLVVNTFVKDALSKGTITLHCGGEMWRPLVEVHDVARAYIACLGAPEELVRGQIINVSSGNLRISELALRVRTALAEMGVDCDIRPDYAYRGVRSYRVSTQKCERVLGIRPTVSLEESVKNMVSNVRSAGYCDFEAPKYYNIRWMRTLEEGLKAAGVSGSVFSVRGDQA